MPKGFPKNAHPEKYPPKAGETPLPPETPLDIPPAPVAPGNAPGSGEATTTASGGNVGASSAGAGALPSAKPKRSNQYTKARESKAVEQAQANDALNALSDENIGRTLGAAFQLVGFLPGKLGGPHWRLMQDEEAAMGRAFGPICRRHPELLGELVQYVMLAPTVLAVVAPRVFVTGMVWKGTVPLEAARFQLLNARVLMRAENELNVEAQVQEAKMMLQRQARQAAEAAAQFHAAELHTTATGQPPPPLPVAATPAGVPNNVVPMHPAPNEVSKYTADDSLPKDLASVAVAPAEALPAAPPS